MGFSLGNLFDPVGVFSGDKGDIFNNFLDPVGGFMQTFDIGQGSDYGDLHEGIGNWMDDLGDGNSKMAQNRWKNFYKGDGFKRAAMTGDVYASGTPWGTKINNELWQRDDKPVWDSLGGKTSGDYQYAEAQGEDTSANMGVDTVGKTVGNGFLNAFTFGLGSTLANAADAWGTGGDYEDVLKKGAKNYAINYAANGALDGAGEAIGNTGGYAEAGGGYVGNNEYGGTGSFNLGKSVGAGEYAPVVNSVAKGAAGGAISAAGQGGNSNDIGKGAATGAAMQGIKQGATMAGDYLGNMFSNDEAVKPYGSSPSLYASNPAADSINAATVENAPAERPYGSSSTGLGVMGQTGLERPMSIQSSQSQASPVSDFLQSMGIGTSSSGSGGGGGLGNYGDLAGSLFGMYNANKQKKKLQEQQSQLQNLFSPNSPYAQQARQAMERKDAAGGRRSQYGPREMQLAAMLADRQAQTMPQQQQYANAIGGYDNAMINNGLRGAGQFYKQLPQMGQDLDSLYRMFQGGQ